MNGYSGYQSYNPNQYNLQDMINRIGGMQQQLGQQMQYLQQQAQPIQNQQQPQNVQQIQAPTQQIRPLYGRICGSKEEVLGLDSSVEPLVCPVGDDIIYKKILGNDGKSVLYEYKLVTENKDKKVEKQEEGGRGTDIERIQIMNNDNLNNRFDTINDNMNRMEIVNFEKNIIEKLCDNDKDILQGFGKLSFENAILAKDNEISALKCCCETNENIQNVKFEMCKGFGDILVNEDKNTCAIITNQNALAKDAELKAAYEKINYMNTALSEQKIINAITANLQPPRPIPAYSAMNPYENFIAPVRVIDDCRRGYNNCGYNDNCGFGPAFC